MRLMKMFGLAALVAVAATAFLGASSASAKYHTALCKVTGQLACPADQLVTSVHAVATNPTLLSSVANISCASSLAQATVLGLSKLSGKTILPQEAHFTALTWSNCSTESGTACTVTTESLGLVLILKTALDLADTQAHDTEVHVQCGFFINCTYGGLPEFRAQGATYGGNGALIAEETELESTGGGFCPATSKWDAEYESLSPIYIKS